MKTTKKTPTKKGMLVHVLRSALGDCTNGGVTSRFASFVLVGEGVAEIFEADAKTPMLVATRSPSGRGWYAALPDEVQAGRWFMHGGNYVETSDSRFTDHFGGPIRVHDRTEEWPR